MSRLLSSICHWTNKKTVTDRNHTIDLLKGIAIILVVITHYGWTDEQRKFFVFPFIINMAIPVFMIISGYVYSLSLSKRKIQHLEDAYVWQLLLRRISRYTFPVIIVILWELCDSHFSISSDPLEGLRWVINGTNGQGSYYFPVMMQLVFVFPLIYFVIDKAKEKGLRICFIANACYELLAWAYGMNTSCYRLLVFRYVFLVAAGVYAYKGYKISIWLSVIMMVIGATFISIVVYFEYETKIVNKDWATTGFLSSMLIVPIMIFVLRNLKNGGKIYILPFEIIGRASYHIFLVQMVYYSGYYSILQNKIPSWQWHLTLGIIISLVVGVVLYYLEKPLQNKIQNLLFKKFERKTI